VLTVSESVRSELAAFGHPEKITVTPNGIDAFFFDAQAGLPAPHHNYFLFVGNDKPHKNVERLVDAFAIVRKTGKVSLVLAGGDFSRYAKRLGVALQRKRDSVQRRHRRRDERHERMNRRHCGAATLERV